MDNQEHYNNKKKSFKKAIYVAAVINFILGLGKVIVGTLFFSHSLVIDGIHSFTDLLSDIALLWISSVAHQGPDEDHPYGHERIETIGTVGIGSILLVTAGALVYETIDKLFFYTTEASSRLIPGKETLYMAVASILLNEFLFHYTKKQGQKINNPLLEANAWHHRTDAISSFVVVIGLIFSWTSFVWVDDLAALIIAVMIAKVGWEYLFKAIKELTDTGLEPAEVAEFEKTILAVDGVKSSHNLRTRRMGEKVLVDVNIEVDPGITVSEGHEIASWTAKNLKHNYESVSDVTVHTDTENDMVADYTHNYERLLPLRSEVLEILKKQFEGQLNLADINEIRLHYIGKIIKVELIIDQDKEYLIQLEADLNKGTQVIDWLGSVSFLIIPNKKNI